MIPTRSQLCPGNEDMTCSIKFEPVASQEPVESKLPAVASTNASGFIYDTLHLFDPIISGIFPMRSKERSAARISAAGK